MALIKNLGSTFVYLVVYLILLATIAVTSFIGKYFQK
jgi:hypothetical protein